MFSFRKRGNTKFVMRKEIYERLTGDSIDTWVLTTGLIGLSLKLVGLWLRKTSLLLLNKM